MVASDVSVTINRVKGIDSSIEPLGRPDFYTKISIDGTTWESGEISNKNDISPNWTFGKRTNKTLIPIRIQIWDNDSFLRLNDDHVDINGKKGARDINLTYDLATNQIIGDLSGVGGQLFNSRGGGDSDRAEVWFQVNKTSYQTIMPIGDSLTLGYPGSIGYRGALLEALNRTSLKGQIDFVGSQVPSAEPLLEHEAATGRTIEKITDLVNNNTIQLASYDPDSFLLMAGTNNLRFFGTQKTFATDANSAASKLENLVSLIREKAPGQEKIFVASIPYININSGFFEGSKDLNGDGIQNNDRDQLILNHEVYTYNNAIEALSDRYNDVYFVDVNHLFKDGELTFKDLSDGVHPTPSGYKAIADVWFRELVLGLTPSSKLDVVLANNNPQISSELAAYIPTVKGSDPLIGFNGTNIGQGYGDGVDEIVGFSFAFPQFKSVQAAYLTLDLTPGNSQINTDELLFADNSSTRGENLPGVKFYGNDLLKGLQVGVRQSVTFDLSNIDTKIDGILTQPGLPEDLRNLLLDGDLNLVYADDAIIHNAHLEIIGTPAHEIVGTEGPDTRVGTSQDESLKGLGGNDTIAGGLGNDAIYGGDGDDVLRGDRNERSSGGKTGGNDIIYGGKGNDRIGGKGGNDQLYGDEGNDQIWGDDGDDLLRGGLGNDTLTGDDLSGGTGRDIFVLAVGEGTDTVVDFKIGLDLIGLAGDLSFGQLTRTQQGNDTWLESNDEVLAVLTGVRSNLLTQSSFVSV